MELNINIFRQIKRKFITSFITILSLGILFSCTKEIKIDVPKEESKLVVDGRIETGKAPMVLLMQSQYLYNPTSLSSYFAGNITNANLSVFDGNNAYLLSPFSPSELPLESQITLCEMLNMELLFVQSLPIKVFSSLDPQSFGQPGKSYTLNIDYAGKQYTSSVSLRHPQAIENLAWIPDPENNLFGVCLATLNDPINARNAYRWESKIITSINGQAKDYRFRHGNSSYFSDEFFNGLSIQFDVKYPEKDTTYPSGFKRHFKLGDSVVVRFSHIDIPVFNYFDKLHAQLDNNGSPFSSPVIIPSNISNGAIGIWAAYGTWLDTLYCIP